MTNEYVSVEMARAGAFELAKHIPSQGEMSPAAMQEAAIAVYVAMRRAASA